jgi:hypothetical protein
LIIKFSSVFLSGLSTTTVEASSNKVKGPIHVSASIYFSISFITVLHFSKEKFNFYMAISRKFIELEKIKNKKYKIRQFSNSE